jgi:hypothetical protein
MRDFKSDWKRWSLAERVAAVALGAMFIVSAGAFSGVRGCGLAHNVIAGTSRLRPGKAASGLTAAAQISRFSQALAKSAQARANCRNGETAVSA